MKDTIKLTRSEKLNNKQKWTRSEKLNYKPKLTRSEKLNNKQKRNRFVKLNIVMFKHKWTRSAKAEHRDFGGGLYPHRSKNKEPPLIEVEVLEFW